MMKIFYRNRKPYLSWGFHELAWSRRTEGIEYPIWDAQGNRVDGEFDRMYSQKRAGNYKLPEGAKFLLVRYFSGSGYPDHQLYSLPGLDLIAEFDRNTTPEEISQLDIPEPIKNFLFEDLF